jgi:plastocyanin
MVKEGFVCSLASRRTRFARSYTGACLLAVFVALGSVASAYQELSPNQRKVDVQKQRTARVKMAGPEAAPPAGDVPQLWEVHIRHFQYNNGQPLKIKSGDSVVWINDDDMQHTATKSDGKTQFDTGFLQPGQRSKAISFLAETDSNGINYSCQVHDEMLGQLVISGPVAPPHAVGPAREAPSTHSFVVMGRESMYLHHIALFQDANHQYEVTLEATLEDPGAQKAYQAYRKQYGDELTVIDPENFILGEIESGKRTSFHANFFRKQWESPIDGLQKVVVRVKRKILFRHFANDDAYAPRLSYPLIGSGQEAFLIHRISASPNFQEVIKLTKPPDFIDAESLASAPDLIVVDKQIAADDTYALRAAVLSNGTHILMGPPPGTLTPKAPTTDGEELTVRLGSETTTHKITVDKSIYFDVRILNK